MFFLIVTEVQFAIPTIRSFWKFAFSEEEKNKI